MTNRFDVAIIGGGIVGLAHAWAAARRGRRVLVVERDRRAQGATVRNFGMIWPIGQPAGPLHDTALRSRDAWLELAHHGVLAVEECGSLHLAYREDEWRVLQEFDALGSHAVQLVSAEEILKRAPYVRSDRLLGGLWSDTELRVDPRVAAAQVTTWLANEFGVTFQFETTVTRVEQDLLQTAKSEVWRADKIIVCSNADFQTLFPEVLQSSGLKRCKLQMLQAEGLRQCPSPAPHIAGGLTLRHYTAFQACPSLSKLCERIQNETPELNRFGIHVMASPFPSGRIILGDSHEYDAEITPFNSQTIDDLIMRELHSMLDMQGWKITERWHGVYAKHPTLPVFTESVGEHIEIFAGTGGAGMTLAFGLAEQAWETWESTR